MKYSKSHPETIQSMFDSIAHNYDRTNAVLSFYLHRLWNKKLIKCLQLPPGSHTFVDLCAGTGDIAFGYLKQCSSPCNAILVDFSSEMLNFARQKEAALKTHSHQIEYVQADVQSLPFDPQSVDCASMAYGIRNVKNPPQCFQEVYRVLKPGGCFGILELTRPHNRILKMGHRLYLRLFLPVLGKWLTSNKNAYGYLQQSIHHFIPPEELENQLAASGFSELRRIPLAGGIATLFIGRKV
ncbi:MAG: bifunctional demethylmenaquinone methyltransferase/2-methoxy-6-polyprenyl-1,4-benzoquinol methylase UbiE [Parachlamydia sp.]|jgi:demethylmenaquinone methyltransferase/2-methoxy-6-polyprenyl-1,4-benzoquinol methylase|nr:bifunctional demethylmenaquinone methyltransferase/2-methoxy-6-polyprenyl-1,4-benzoquinol methylase UbiE [Parachlamydia sp.]